MRLMSCAVSWSSPPCSVAMKITGYKTGSVYRRYAIVDATAIDEGLPKLAALHHADATTSRTVVSISQAHA